MDAPDRNAVCAVNINPLAGSVMGGLHVSRVQQEPAAIRSFNRNRKLEAPARELRGKRQG